MKNYNKKFKHIIYTDIKESSAGSKMIAASMMTKGYTNIYDKSLKINENTFYISLPNCTEDYNFLLLPTEISDPSASITDDGCC